MVKVEREKPVEETGKDVAGEPLKEGREERGVERLLERERREEWRGRER